MLPPPGRARKQALVPLDLERDERQVVPLRLLLPEADEARAQRVDGALRAAPRDGSRGSRA
jgi:hypothetical protein